MQKRRHMPPLFSIFPLPVLFSPLSLYFPIISPILIWQVFHAILQAAFLPHLRVLSLHPPFLSPHPPFLSPHPPFLSLFVYTFVQTNIAAMRDSSVAGNSIGIFESVILDIVRYYDTNEFDLKVFKKEYNDFNDAWIDFKNTYVSYMGKRLDRKMQNQLGEKLQLVKEKNQTLISEVRKKY